jgi:hypothetical protein
MSIRQIFECDICHKQFTSRDEKGEPRIIGGVKGAIKENGQINGVDYDFCPTCYSKLIKFINILKHEQTRE